MERLRLFLKGIKKTTPKPTHTKSKGQKTQTPKHNKTKQKIQPNNQELDQIKYGCEELSATKHHQGCKFGGMKKDCTYIGNEKPHNCIKLHNILQIT